MVLATLRAQHLAAVDRKGSVSCIGCLQERLTAVIEAVRAELDALGDGLQRRASVAAARSILELMQDTAHAMSKARAFLCTCDVKRLAMALPCAHVRPAIVVALFLKRK